MQDLKAWQPNSQKEKKQKKKKGTKDEHGRSWSEVNSKKPYRNSKTLEGLLTKESEREEEE